MGRLGCPWNWDAILAYSTVKIVQIQDRRLGLLHYFFMLVILGYIVGFTVLWQMRYLKTEAPVGSIRTSLMSPQTKGLTPPAAESIAYCLQNSTSTNGFPNHECLYWDEDLVVYPTLEHGAMFVTTRITNTSQDLKDGCSLTNNTCKYVPVSPPNDIYVADIEDFTLLIDHAMYTSQLGIQANGQDLSGSLIDSNGDKITNLPAGDTVGMIGKQDILHMSVVLRAAGIDSLDTPGFNDPKKSKRDDGIVLLVFITYSNTYSYNTNNINYEITVKAVSDTKFKSEQPIYTKNYEKRVIWNRHGVRLLFLTVGSLGKFDFQTLLLTFVSGIGLLAVSTLIVDVIAVRLMPGRQTYKKYKYQETPITDPSEATEVYARLDGSCDSDYHTTVNRT